MIESDPTRALELLATLKEALTLLRPHEVTANHPVIAKFERDAPQVLAAIFGPESEEAKSLPRSVAEGIPQANTLIASLEYKVRAHAHSIDTSAAPSRADWEDIRTLGAGGQGEATLVRRGSEEGVRKRLRADRWKTAAHQSQAVERFKREVAIAAEERHPMLVGVLDSSGLKDEVPSVVYEYIPMGALSDHMVAFVGDAWRTLRLVRDVAVGLERLERRNVVHRDVKPENVLLRSLDHAAIGDYGIALLAGESRLTRTSESVGAWWYRPPEADRGRVDDLGVTFDVYCLGKLLHHVLSGVERLPREYFLKDEFNLERLFGERMAPINRLLGRMIVEDPAKRLLSMKDVIAELDGVIGIMFGALDPQKCIACRRGDYVDLGKLSLVAGSSGSISAGGRRLEPKVWQCRGCGHLRLIQPVAVVSDPNQP